MRSWYTSLRVSGRPDRARGKVRRGFTIMEVMLVLIIMSIAAVLGMDVIAEFEAAQRSDRAARESMAFFRMARYVAMTTGKKAKVVVDPTAMTVAVYWQSNGTSYDATAYASGMTGTGTAVLSVNTRRELAGTTITAPNTSTYYEYSTMGNCDKSGTVTFSYSGRSKSLVISQVGDPRLQ